jgi:hypothetical protein
MAGPKERLMFATTWASPFGKGLQSGWLTSHIYKLIAGGLGGLEAVLNGLMGGSSFKHAI